ncbi:MAG: site-specific integrase [Candidatus Brocadiales bacterium]|nr:site-specific integrase [Candidatus Brocadiales bacterium]
MLQLVSLNPNNSTEVSSKQKENDHQYLIEQYIGSHFTRNHSIRTIQKEKRFLESWFQNYPLLFAWDAMMPLYGRERIVEYANTLIESEVSHHTMRSNINILSRLFSYILEHPYLKRGDQFIPIEQVYGAISQPVSEYDIPKHSYDGEQLGIPMDPEEIFHFYHCLRNNYLIDDDSVRASSRARYYAMAILAGLSGFRIDELLHLDYKKDIFLKSCKIQTRYAKGTSGSGKRSRITLFPPLARDTLKYYIKNHRPKIYVNQSDLLFPNHNGAVLSYSSVHNALNDMINIAKKNSFSVMNHMSWHWFRRIFATRFIEQHPHQLSVLVQLLGHTSPNTVHRYIRHSEAWMDKKILKALQGDFI